jgi:hypothetical protein
MAEAQLPAGGKVSAAYLNGLPAAVAPLATGSVSNTTAETVIGSFSIPGSTITATGNGLAFRIFGTADATGTPNLTLKMHFGTAGSTADLLIFTGLTIAARAGTNFGWVLDGWFYFTTVGASGVIDGVAYQSQQVSTATDSPPNWAFATGLSTIDTTVAESLTVSATWGTASASNVCRTLVGAVYPI